MCPRSQAPRGGASKNRRTCRKHRVRARTRPGRASPAGAIRRSIGAIGSAGPWREAGASANRRRAATRPPPARVVLEEAGTSYQRLLDEVRQQAARQPLEDTQLEAGEIAFVPGFGELNSSTRAFRGWEGTTPARWRTAQARAS